MDVRSAITRWAGAGATRNARASLDEWTRAQEEVSALLTRLDHADARPGPTPPLSVEDRQRSGGRNAVLVARQLPRDLARSDGTAAFRPLPRDQSGAPAPPA